MSFKKEHFLPLFAHQEMVSFHHTPSSLSSRDGSQSLWVWGKCVRSTPEISVPLWKTVETYFMPCVRTLLVKSERSHLKFSFPVPVHFNGLVFLSLQLNKTVPAEPSALPPGSHHPREQGWQGGKGSLGKCAPAQGLPMQPAISHSDCAWVSKGHPVWIRSWVMLSNTNIKTIPSVNVMKFFSQYPEKVKKFW